jgi:hypothetical protein
MPPRFAYWTILIDGKPTAFRAREQDELLPTFGQLKRKNADVVLRWFARGRLWDSPDAERAAARAPKKFEKRAKDWRPGGEHKDPRQHWRDQKKQRNQERRAERHERRSTTSHTRSAPAFAKGFGGSRRSSPQKHASGGGSPSGERRDTRKPNPHARSAPAFAKGFGGSRRSSPQKHASGGGSPSGERHHAPNARMKAPNFGKRFDKPRDEKPWSNKPTQPWREKPPRRDADRPPKPTESPDSPPVPEQIVRKPEPPERG